MATYTDITTSVTEIVTLTDFKMQIKEIDPAEAHHEDVLFQQYIDASIEECEAYINRAILDKQYKVVGKSFADVLVSSLQTIKSVEKIEYKDENGSLQTLSSDAYYLDAVDDFETKIVYSENIDLPVVKEFTPDAVQLYITVGLPKVSKKIKQAVLLKAGAMDKFRTDYVKNKPTASERLLNSFIRY